VAQPGGLTFGFTQRAVRVCAVAATTASKIASLCNCTRLRVRVIEDSAVVGGVVSHDSLQATFTAHELN